VNFYTFLWKRKYSYGDTGIVLGVEKCCIYCNYSATCDTVYICCEDILACSLQNL